MIFNPKLKIYRWISNTEKTLYVFNDKETSSMKETIFKDDTIEMAMNKIATFIAKKENIENFEYYAWNNKGPVLFSIKKHIWKGYNINPFLSSDNKSPDLNENVQYEFKLNSLFNLQTVNLVFIKDLPVELQDNKYYNIDLKLNTYEYYKKHNDKLMELLKVETDNIKRLSTFYTRILFQGKLKQINLLSTLFDNIHTSKYIDMVQWIDDSSKILYKLYKKHNIKEKLFSNWTNVEYINDENVLYLYSIIDDINSDQSDKTNNGSYCKIKIDANSNIQMHYYLEARANIEWNIIYKHKSKIINILQNTFKQKLILKEVSLNAKRDIEIHNSSFDLLKSKISKQIDVFNIIKNKNSKNSISCIFKRSSNYSQNTDIYDYIKTRIELGINEEYIVNELAELGINGDLLEMVRNTQYMINNEDFIESQHIKIENNGTIITILKYNSGYNILISNCVDNNELERLFFWLDKIISTTIVVVKKQADNNTLLEDSPSNKSKSSKSEEKQEDLSDKSFETNDSSNSLSFGGAKKDGYMLNKLKQADPNLFKNYARTCQKKVQPIVFNESQKQEYENKDLLRNFDNYIEHGSAENIKNYYACPKLWCPVSNVPLSIDDPNPTCPKDNEEPILAVWDINDKTKKRYVNLVKPKDNGMIVPCCSVKPPINKKEEQKDNDNYIMSQPAPIPVGRYGSIPDYLHNLLFNNQEVSPDQCKTTLNKTHKCFVRKGVKKNANESAILSIIELLDFKNKKQFVSYVREKLDLLTFISLENGYICKQFMNNNKFQNISKSFMSNLKKFAENKQLFNIGDVEDHKYLYHVYHAYNKYIDYIAADDFSTPKNPHYLYSLIHRLYNISILICEKDESGQVYIHCPSSYYEIEEDFEPIVAIIMKDDKYYEPIEIKMRNTEAQKVFKLREYPMLHSVVNKCAVDNKNTTYNNLHIINNWINSDVLEKKTDFQIKYIYINDDLSIDKILLKSNILLKFEKMGTSILPKILKNFHLKSSNIIFYGNHVDKIVNVKIYFETDLQKFVNICKEYNITITVGDIIQSQKSPLMFKMKLSADKMEIPPSQLLHSNQDLTSRDVIQSNKVKSNKWFQLQNMVVNRILKKMTEQQLKQINLLKRNEKIRELMDLFQKEKDKKTIQIILEEIPTKSFHALKLWLSKNTIFTKYDVLNENITNNPDSKEFVFSQSALIHNGVRNIPDILFIYHDALPNNRNIKHEVLQTFDISNESPLKTSTIISKDLPNIFKGVRESLGTKWIKNKNKIWKQMKYVESAYNIKTIPMFFDWLCVEVKMPNVKFESVLLSGNNKLMKIVNNTECITELLEDPFLFNAIKNKMNKSYIKNLQKLLELYQGLSQEQRLQYFTEILRDEIYVNDLHIIAISELLNISILLIHRKKYGKVDDKSEYKDILMSSTLFPSKTNIKERPLVILQKRVNASYTHTIYDIVLQENSTELIYKKLSIVPESIQELVYSLYQSKKCNSCVCEK